MLRGKRFGSDEEVIAETEAYFEGLDKSLYTGGAYRKAFKRWSDFITLKRNYIDE